MSGYHLIPLTYDKFLTYLNAPNYRLLPLVGSSLSRKLFALEQNVAVAKFPPHLTTGKATLFI